MVRQIPVGAGFAYAVAIRTLDEQLRRIEALDTKAGVLIAADGVIIGLLASERSALEQAHRIIGAVVLGAIAMSLITPLLAFATRHYQTAPNPDAVIRLMTADQSWLEWRFLGNLRAAIEVNRQNLRQKARLLATALVLLIAGSTSLSGYLLTDTVTRGG